MTICGNSIALSAMIQGTEKYQLQSSSKHRGMVLLMIELKLHIRLRLPFRIPILTMKWPLLANPSLLHPLFQLPMSYGSRLLQAPLFNPKPLSPWQFLGPEQLFPHKISKLNFSEKLAFCFQKFNKPIAAHYGFNKSLLLWQSLPHHLNKDWPQTLNTVLTWRIHWPLCNQQILS